MDNKNNKEKVITFRLSMREAISLQECMDAEERPGVPSLHGYARDVVVQYLAKKRKAQLAHG